MIQNFVSFVTLARHAHAHISAQCRSFNLTGKVGRSTSSSLAWRVSVNTYFSPLFLLIQTTLLVLNTLSSPFYSTSLTTASRSSLLDQIKSILAKNCALRRLSVITIVQMATKLLSKNGSNASPNYAVQAKIVPQLGKKSNHIFTILIFTHYRFSLFLHLRWLIPPIWEIISSYAHSRHSPNRVSPIQLIHSSSTLIQ